MKKAIAWILCAMWMGVIFGMSAMPGNVSQAQSESISGMIMALFSMLFGEKTAAISAETLNHVVRKAAHMTEYAILFILYARALQLSGVKKSSLTAFLLCVLYAATDEFHQSFTADRGPMVSDVGIDAIGAGIGYILKTVYWKMKGKRE